MIILMMIMMIIFTMIITIISIITIVINKQGSMTSDHVISQGKKRH